MPAHGKTPIFICEDQGRPRWWPLFIKTGKWATGEQLEQPGDDSLLWHCTGRVVPESAVQSAEQYVGRVCVSFLGDTESVLSAFHCVAARLTAYSRIAPTPFVLLHLLSLVLGSFCSCRMQQKKQNNTNQDYFNVRITQSFMFLHTTVCCDCG